MSDITYAAIDPERLDAMRQAGADEFGDPWKPQDAEGCEHIRFVEPGDDHGASAQAVMDHPDVAYLHVRSAVAQCFTFEVRRA
ncbi:MAG: DUF1203 domain-containing protein [Micromonosporaceae bacterium]